MPKMTPRNAAILMSLIPYHHRRFALILLLPHVQKIKGKFISRICRLSQAQLDWGEWVTSEKNKYREEPT